MLQKSPETAPIQPQAGAPDISAVLGKAAPARLWRRWIVPAFVVVVAAAGAWAWSASHGRSLSVTYLAVPVARGDLTVTVTATGTVQPTNQVDISSELSGTVATVDADFNAHVTKGATLATLNTDNLEAAVALSQATLAARQADVQQAQATVSETAAAYARTAPLAEKGLSSASSAESAKAAADRAQAALASSNANLKIAQANASIAQSDLGKAQIVSPIDGIVLSRAVEPGQTVASSLQAPVLFTLAEDLTKMQLQVDIDEADVGKVAEGDKANFTVEAFANRQFPATISQVRYSPATVEGVVTYKAILTVDNTDLLLRPGMTATAEITVDHVTDTLLVPNAALRYSPPAAPAAGAQRQRSGGLLGLLLPQGGPGGPGGRQRTTVTPTGDTSERTIYVLRDNAPVAVHVKTGVTDGTRTAIVSGDLKEGDRVITGSRAAG
ncbi:MAG TPA: efflux RND transporter periplasmic adaptor subunit [Bauldia sp.]|nr:efflux RND transporter periplasmic adaptor subunit [Bauldia sp.]